MSYNLDNSISIRQKRHNIYLLCCFMEGMKTYLTFINNIYAIVHAINLHVFLLLLLFVSIFCCKYCNFKFHLIDVQCSAIDYCNVVIIELLK